MNNKEWVKLNDENVQSKSNRCRSPSRKTLIILLVSLSIVSLSLIIVLVVLVCTSFKKEKENVLNLTLIADVFPDGQRITAVAVSFETGSDYLVDNSKLTDETFSVKERNITSIHSSSSLADPHRIEDGKYVIIELNPKDDGSETIYSLREKNFQGRKNVTLHVKQEKEIELVNGGKLAKSTKTYTNEPDINKSISLIVDDFTSEVYIDKTDSRGLAYNLYIPQSLRKSSSSSSDRKYPLILFMHDASVHCNDTRMSLFQGVGGTVWATKEEQQKHESFVVAPCFTDVIVNDDFVHSGQYSYIMPMLDDIINNKYKDRIDTNRLYTTGQSMGCMTSISLMCEYPQFFASGMFVAGQWDVKVMENLLNQSFWILVSETDMKAPAQDDKAMDNLEALGAKISRAVWFGNATEEEKRKNVESILSEGNDKMYIKFVNKTVVPDDVPYNPGLEHMYTWKVAYLIEGVRDWLFNNHLN